MSRKRLFICIIFFIIAVLTAVTLYGCENAPLNEEVTIDKIEITSTHEGPYILNANGHIENMDLSEITFKVFYSNKEQEIVTVNDSMFSTEDLNKFETKGDHTLFINFGKTNIPLSISVRSQNEANLFTAIFETDEGSKVENQYTNIISRFADPFRENYTFDGWYTNVERSGDRVIAPYTLKADTVFYAKWIDNRRCNVTFYYVEDGVRKYPFKTFEVVYGSSIDLENYTEYPQPEIEGKIFTGWFAESGEAHNITSDLIIRATYNDQKCNIELYGGEGYEGNYIDNVSYGTKKILNEIPPEKAGHEVRWGIEKSQTEIIELTDDSINYDEETQTLTINQDIKIVAVYEINVYTIEVYNGLESQIDINLKNGNILLEQIYKDGEIFKKEYNTTFNLAVVGGKNDVEATSYKGYNVEWCFITYDETNKEIWRNSRNLVWNDEYGGFKLNTENNDEESSNYSLKDVDGNILAQIKDGNITEIQGDIIIKPKYTKKKYMVTLRRQNQELPIEFEVPYLTDFELYNPSVKEYEGKYSSWSEVRDSYLLNTVDSWLTQELVGEESWQNEKWDINWYNNPSMSDNKVDFSYDEQTGTYGYYTIEENTVLYAKDIDNRTYDVTIYYNYNFLQNTYDKEEKYPPLKKDDALELPSDLSSSITYDGIVFSYAALYDFPYSGPTTKYIAPPVTNYDSRTKNVVYYAHYQNRSKYDVKIFDKTQSEAYVDPDSPFIVLDGSIMYSLYSGTQFDSTMLYKGTPTIIAQTKYNNKVFYENFYNVTQVLYTDYLEPYDNKDDALSAIQALINDKQEVIEDYLKLLDILSGYDYDNIDLEKYASCEDYYKKYFTNQENCYDMNKIYIEKNGDSYTYISNAYDTYREEIYDLQQIIKLINDYEENALRATNYENDEYYPYSDSVTHLNAIYEAGVTDYYFAGWYYDSNYTQKADDIASDPENPMSFSVKISKDLILYAKWVDKKKGSEGLIFEKVAPGEVIVVDYLNEAQCQAIYTESVYSKNLNDQGNMPTDLGTKVSLQIPSEHKFVLPDGSIEICTVVGIVNGAFDTNATIISDLALPNSIKFIEESTFKYCNIKAISYQMGETNYLYVDADIVVYQNLNYSDRNGTVLANSKVLGSYQAGVLITYANKSIVNTSYVIPDEINGTPVTKLADYAFRSTPALVGVSLGENITEIGDYAFMGCNKLASVDLPNSLITIGTNAFKDCSLLANVNFVASTAYPVAQLRYIEKDAFSNTSWFINQKGLILVDTILLGVQFRGDGKGYEVDENGDNLVNEYNENFIIGKDQPGNTIYTVYIDANSQTITRIVIDLQLTIITDYAFSGMMSLISLDINAQNLISIDDYAFNNCSGLNVVYFRGADPAINIGENILAGCSRNISFVFPQGYITVNNFLTGDRWVELSSKIDMMEIAEGTQSTLTYYRKARGTTVTIPSFVTEIDDNVFSVGFGDTAEVIIPNTVTKIGENTFANMTNLTSIMIPSSVLEIGLGAFYNCTGLTQMTLPFIGNTSVNNNYLGYIFGDLETTYMNQDFYVPTMLQKLILLDNNTFTEISDYALYNLNIKEITFTNYITRIGKYAFWGNTKLVTLNFNQYIETVDEYAFHGCTSLTTLTFHNYSNLESFGDYSFYGCTSLQALNIITNAYTTTIGNYAFANCTLLRNVYFNQNLESIGNSAFEGCVALGVVNFTSNGVLSVIGANAFKNCTSLQNIIVNKQLSSIGFGAFEGCANLASITLNFIGANLNGTQATHFGYIFGAETYQVGMSKMPISLETVIVQQNGLDQAINIADYAFFNLTNLTLVNISNANIGNEGALAFYGCTATITR